MKTKIVLIVATLSSLIAAPAVAALVPEDAARTAGGNYSVSGVWGIQEEVDISSLMDNDPVLAQAFLKHYAQSVQPGVSWSETGIGAAAIYDFNSVARLDSEVHPYAGIGLVYVFHSWTGTGAARPYAGAASGPYLTGGVRYSFTPRVAADLNYNTFGDLTAGINYSF